MPSIVPDEVTFEVFDVVASTTGPFNFGFQHTGKPSLRVTVDNVSVDFNLTPGSVVDAAGYDGGSFSLLVAVADARVVIYRLTTVERDANLTGANLTFSGLNGLLNEFAYTLQELRRDIARALLANFGETGGVVDPDNIAAVAAIADEVSIAAGIDAEILIAAGLAAEITAVAALDADDLAAIAAGLAAKADQATTYTKVETDNLLGEREPLRNDIVRLSSYGSNQAAFELAIAAAKADDLWLDCEGATVTLTSLLNLTGAGIYKWMNLIYEKLTQTSADYENTITINGVGVEAPIALSANAAVGATSITLASGTGLAEGDQFYITHNEEYSPDYPTTTVYTGEWIEASAVDTGTGVVTLSSPLLSSYRTASSARVYRFPKTTEVWMKNVTARGGGVGERQGGMRLNWCVVKQWEDMRSFDNEFQSFEWQICINEALPGTVYSEGSIQDGLGYGQVVGGCLNWDFGSVKGKGARHMVTCGASATRVVPDGNLSFMGQGGNVSNVHCTNARGDPFDSHFGERAYHVGAVTGNLVPGTGESALTLQSPDATINSWNVTGGDQGQLIQCWGKPSDEPAPYFNLGQCNTGRGGTGTNWALAVENLDATTRRLMTINVDAFGGDYPGLIVLDAEQGDINMHVGHLTGRSRSQDTVRLVSSANSRARMTVARNDAVEDSGNASVYLVNADGSAYENANSGSFGAFFHGLSGDARADNTAYYANDALINITGMRGTTTTGQTGIGYVLDIGATLTASVAVGSAVSLTTSTLANVTSLALPPGKWRVFGQVGFNPAGTTSITQLIAAINTVSATMPDADAVGTSRNQQQGAAYVPGTSVQVLDAGEAIITTTTGATAYLMARGTFTVAALSAFGKLQAERLA